MLCTPRLNARVLPVLALSFSAALLTVGTAHAKDIQFKPHKGGTIKIAVWGVVGDKGNDKTNEISVTLPDAPAESLTADAKARHIARRINASFLNNFYKATPKNGEGKVQVEIAAGFAGTVKFAINSDDTEEGVDLGTCSAGQNLYYYCQAPASGVPWDINLPASITVGTSTHTTTVLTSPGASPVSLLSTARANLIANGVPNVTLVTLPGGGAFLRVVAGPGDTHFAFGTNDTGHGYKIMLTDDPEIPVPGHNPVGLVIVLLGLLALGSLVVLRNRRTA